MIANELSKRFLLWFQSENPTARIYRNNAGKFKIDNRWMSFGIPNKGGADFIAFVPKFIKNSSELMQINRLDTIEKTNYYILTVQFYEIKTAKDKMSKDQIKFANMITEMGGEYFIVHEKSKIACIANYNKNIIQDDNPDFYLEKWGNLLCITRNKYERIEHFRKRILSKYSENPYK